MSLRRFENLTVRPLIDQSDQTTRRDNTERAARVVLTEDVVTETATVDNDAFAMSSTPNPDRPHAKATLTRAGGALIGRGNSRMTGAEFENQSLVNGMLFTDAVDITATPAGAVLFYGCMFDKLITMTAGTQAHFAACLFRDEAAVNNAGAAGNVSITGCHRSSGVAHVNVTIISETT